MEFRAVNIRREAYDIYCGRAGHGKDGKWGNPVVIGRKCPECGKTHMDAGSTIPCYTRYLVRMLEDLDFRTEFNHLRSLAKALKRPLKLGCFCVKADGSGACHTKVMIEFLKGDV